PALAGTAGLGHAAGVRLDADDRAVAGAGDDDQVVRGGRRRDDAEHAVVGRLGVQLADAPEFGAVLEAVCRAVVAAEHHQVLVLAVAPEHRRRVGLLALVGRVGLAADLPDFLAACLVDGEYPPAAG